MSSLNESEAMQDPALARYSRQMLYSNMGGAAQRKLLSSRVTLIGCGGLGTVLADTLVRAGVGFLRVVDRDYVELNNLQRQVLFGEAEAHEGLPKAMAAARSLARINSAVAVEPVVADVHAGNVESFASGADLLLDGTDNFEARFLINDVAVKHRIPWVYGACVGADGMVMPVVPGQTPCLRCVWEQPPPVGASLTCDTVGILASVVHVVASLQAVEALKILTGQIEALNRRLVQVNLWTGQFTQFDLQAAFDSRECPCCHGGRYDFLAAPQPGGATLLCGRRTVQISPPGEMEVDLDEIAARVARVAKSSPQINRYLLRFEVDNCQVTVFRDGRAIVKGTADLGEARSIYARYIGS
jgi:adenylyltransferase/sulfurtransferase